MADTTMARVAVMKLDDHPFYEVMDETIVEQMPMGAYELWIAAVLTLHLRGFLKQHSRQVIKVPRITQRGIQPIC